MLTPAVADGLAGVVERRWSASALPALSEFVRIPNQSPLFDPDWEVNGYLDRAAELIAHWARQQMFDGAVVEVLREPGRTPAVVVDVPGDAGAPDDHPVLLYGHLDKQPPGEGWTSGLSPHEPEVRDGRLYGRGAADDGYAPFAALTALAAVRELGRSHARCVLLLEASEESQSRDLRFHLDRLAPRLGTPSLVLVLDSVCGDYERLWVTTSLRGSVVGILRVRLLERPVHSGTGGGVAPSGFRVARHLLDRLENSRTGEVLPPSLHAEIPAGRRTEAERTAHVLGDDLLAGVDMVSGAWPVVADPVDLLLARTWRPALVVTGQEGLPPIEAAGNVIGPGLALKLSLRLPPTADPDSAARAVKETLEAEPPYGAQVSFEVAGTGAGWAAGEEPRWLRASLTRGSRTFFGAPPARLGVGGGIPVVDLLGRAFPSAQLLVTGLLGPGANPHGPDESLHLDAAWRLTCCLAQLFIDHYHQLHRTEGGPS